MLDIARTAPPVSADPPPRRPGTAHGLIHIAQDLARRTEIWRPRVQFDHDSRYAARLAVNDDYEAWLLTWLPGQSTGLHDHGSSTGAFIVLAGALHEAVLAPTSGRQPSALLRRTLAASRYRTFTEGYVHDVTNLGTAPAVSLHVYAPALDTMRRFVLDASGRPQVVARERSGVDW